MPKRVEPPFDIKSFMEHGDQFHRAMLLFGKQPNDDFANIATPFVVCSAFALEVYLKVLAHIEKNVMPLKTHDLLHLCSDLSKETQERLEREWLLSYARTMNMQSENPHLPEGYPRVQTFRQGLELSSQAFVEWRYSSRSKNRAFSMSNLVPISRRIIVEKRPDLITARLKVQVLDNPIPTQKPCSLKESNIVSALAAPGT